MRPLRIELEGFSAFKEPTEVDFSGVDLFAFAGPTGSGKSSVIDAIVFALYGSVPRYDDNRLVAPIITQGAVEAKVRLRFTAGGDTYTAVRVVRRTKSGASTKEARLERGDETIAGDAKAMTAEVERLVGLSIDQFTTCVVLPQGKFATLLHEKPARRQDLLVKLLDLGLYEQLAGLARQRERDAAKRVELLDQQLEADADVTSEARDALVERVDRLTELVAEVHAAVPEQAELDRRVQSLTSQLEQAELRSAELAAVSAPDDVARLAEALAVATTELAEAEQAEQAAHTAMAEAQDARDGLGDRSPLERARADHEARDKLEVRRAKGQALIAEADEQRQPLVAVVDDAARALDDARAGLERARVADLAADLAGHVHVGDDCPVCGRELEVLPDLDRRSITASEQRVRQSERDLQRARDALTDHDRSLERYRGTLAEIDQQLSELAHRLADTPAPDEITRDLAAIAAADERLSVARAADQEARRRRSDAAAAFESARADEARARRDLATCRDHLAALPPLPSPPDEAGKPAASSTAVPPSPSGDDLVDDWQSLAAWASTSAAAASEAADRLTTELAELADHRSALAKRLAEAFDRAGVALVDEPTVAARREADAARADLARHDERMARVERLRGEREQAKEVEQVHRLLKGLLGSSGFEQWLLDEALDALVEGATRWLDQLSSGAYALTLDSGSNDFSVIDHRNAGEVRLARTLSGGETFLASLALALALAERVGELAADGAPRLEAIFLDEGFGTLDPETLDVVATAIEELGATGRMVGVVSHVRDLAERVPTRYEVSKGPSTSTVERIDR